MKLRDLFSPVANLSVQEAEEYIQNTPAVQVVDVRQPSEYQQGHLPGAILIPLKELGARKHELDSDQPVLAYCAVGGRSLVAARMLSGMGFPTVFNLSGGIKAWQGATAQGTEDTGFELLSLDADFDDALAMAYAMEAGLQKYYLTIRDSHEEEIRDLADRLAGFEKGHMLKLMSLAPGLQEKQPPSDEEIQPLEGGRVSTPPSRFKNPKEGIVRLLETAVAFEAQAWDLYSRLQRKSTDPRVQKLFATLAGEEQAHLEFVSATLEKTMTITAAGG